MRQTYVELENSNIIPQDRETAQNHRQKFSWFFFGGGDACVSWCDSW